VSCGVAEKQPATGCADDLIRDADAMLYLAKEHGRNQTWVLDPGGQGVQVAAGAADLSVPPEKFAGHPPASPMRSRSRTETLQCASAHPDHE
jgi:hypothetical protein